MTDPRNELWSEFLAFWPTARVRQLTVADYTNLNVDDAFVYWLESRTQDLGSIWGGSAYKFGVFARRNTEGPASGNESGRSWDSTHGWFTKYGATAAAAFATVRERIVAVIDAIEAGNLEAIDDIDFSPAIKWKIAFLYQDRAKPVVLPLYKREMLLDAYRQINPKTRTDTPYSLMYATLLDRYRSHGDVFAIGELVWKAWEQKTATKAARAWAVPLSLLDSDDATQLCSIDEVTPEDIPPDLADSLAQAGVVTGDELALLIHDRVSAVGRVTTAAGGELSWEQTPRLDVPSKLVLIPNKPTLLDAAERAAIWDQLTPTPAPAHTRFWKIAPGENAKSWPEWRDGGFIAIGWTDIGDLTSVTEEPAFQKLLQQALTQHPDWSAKGAHQVWDFRGLAVGDRIVANHGIKKVLALGTVTGPYRHVPGVELGHRFPVRWDSLVPREVNKVGAWQKTLVELDADEFAAIEAAPPLEATPPVESSPQPAAALVVAGPCKPQNLILYGPPGTGKTYATIDRALELILGKPVIETMSRDVRVKQFRELQQTGQIEFVTFHQAYGYEEFVEGLRPQLGQDSAEVRYEMHAGAFKSIALRAAAEGLKATTLETPSFDALWDRLLTSVAADENRVFDGPAGKTKYLAQVTARGSIVIRPVNVDDEGNVIERDASAQTASKASAKLLWDHKEKLGEPEKVTTKQTGHLFASASGGGGGHHFTAIWIAYRELFALAKTAALRPVTPEDAASRVQHVLDKKTAGLVDFSFSASSTQYVLIIDEINRGNIAKIMGELITLLEPDKRLGEKGELKLPLAYTPEHRFAVPPNLHVVGTMNTADRSIAVIDVALRRRFRFEELLPDLTVLDEDLRARVPDAPFCELVTDLVRTINDRIRFLYDRDHQLGHAFFMGISNYSDLQTVFLERVVPMLQEYFYGAWDKICAVLGCPYADDGKPRRKDGSVASGAYVAPIVKATVFGEVSTLGFDHDDHDDRLDFTVHRGFAARDATPKDLLPFFVGILGDNVDDRAKRTNALLAGKLVVEANG